ncbi:MAG: protein kinase [Planctomycetes bacterium]|nr:protein kinase [Planctomycetota bacterium]
MDLAPGCWLGDWILEAPLGQGGFGQVFRARHATTGAAAAVKVARDRRDLRAVAVEHPGVVRTLEARLDHDPPFLALELVPDGNLRDALRAGPLPPAEALAVVSQVAAALDHAHGRGLLHLDVKPENVLVDAGRGLYKLTDFSGPRPEADPAALANSLRLTGDVRLASTRDYAAPEVREGAGRLDRRADVYSLGVLAYELLTGRLPLGLDRPSELAPALPRTVDAALERALARAPTRRTLAAGALAADLAQALSASPPPPPADGGRRSRARRPLALAVVVVGALVAGGVALHERSRGSSHEVAPDPLAARLAPLLAELPPGARVGVLPPEDLAARGPSPATRAAGAALEAAVARAGRAPAGASPARPDLPGLFRRDAREELSRAAGCDVVAHAVLPDDGGAPWLTVIDLGAWSVLAATPPRDPAVADLGRRAAAFLQQRGEQRPVVVLPTVDHERGVSNRTTAALDADLLAALVVTGRGRVAARARPGIVERLRESAGEVRRALSAGLALEGRLDARRGALVVTLRDLEAGAALWTGEAGVALVDYDPGRDMDRFTADAAAVDGVLGEHLDRLFSHQVRVEVGRALETAQARLAAGQADDAVALLEALRQRDGPYVAHVEPLLLLGRAHEARGDRARAMSAYEEAAARAPGDPRPREALAALALDHAERLFRQGKRPWYRPDDPARFEEALAVLRRLDGVDLPAPRRAAVEALRRRIEDEL